MSVLVALVTRPRRAALALGVLVLLVVAVVRGTSTKRLFSLGLVAGLAGLLALVLLAMPSLSQREAEAVPGTGGLLGTDARQGNLISINPTTGESALIGPTGAGVLPSLAVDPATGVIYAGRGGGNPNVYTLNKATGTATLLGDSGLGFAAIGGMDFGPDGSLYAAVNIVGDGGTGSDHLATINTSTGAASVIGPFGGPCGSLCTIEGMEAIAFDASGTLRGALSARGAAGAPGLYTIDPSTGAATFVSPIVDVASAPPSGGVVSLQFACDGTLYGGTARALAPANDGGFLVTIDPGTGAFSFVGAVSATGGPSLGALAFQAACGPPPTPCGAPGPTCTATRTPTPTSTPVIKPNDDFAGAVAIPAPLPFSIKQDTFTALLEPGEPRPCAGIGSTVWYSFTPSTDLLLTADTLGSNYDTALAVYTGTSLATLSTVACNDDFFGLLSRVQFTATAGITYHFQVGGFFGRSGNLVFNLAGELVPTPTITPTPTNTPTVTPTPTSGPCLGDACMSFAVVGGDCDSPTQPKKCSVTTGSPFTLAVDVIDAPNAGYIGIQTQIVYGDLVYKPAATAADEIVWPDLGGLALRSSPSFPNLPTGTEGLVNHGAATGTVPPFPLSNFAGPILSLNLNCTSTPDSVDVYLLALGEPIVPPDLPAPAPGPAGSGFKLDGLTQVAAKFSKTAHLDVDNDGELDREQIAKPVPTVGPFTPPPTPVFNPGDLIDYNVADRLRINCVPPPTPTPTNTPTPTPTAVGFAKKPELQNLWLTRQGAKVPPANCLAGSDAATFVQQLNRPLVLAPDPKDPTQDQQLGAFEFDVKYDQTKVCLEIAAGPAADAMTCFIEDSTNSQLEGVARIGCVTLGKTTFPDTNNPVQRVLATLTARPQPNEYSIIKPNQDNGNATQILNVGCSLSDLQGHPIAVAACSDPDVTIRYLEGDVSPDCTVDALDAAAIAARWSASKGSLLYNDFFNLEPVIPADQDIDINDLQFVFGRFGSTCAAPHPPQDPVNPKA